jgi:hypothetical protein
LFSSVEMGLAIGVFFFSFYISPTNIERWYTFDIRRNKK